MREDCEATFVMNCDEKRVRSISCEEACKMGAGENLELSDEIEANMIRLENRAEYWPRAALGLSIGACIGYELPFGSRGVMLARAGYRSNGTLTISEKHDWAGGIA